MTSRHAGRLTPSRVITDSGVDHVRLAYHYLDTGDLDGYGSLLHAGTALGADLECPAATGARHHITRIVAEGDCVIAMGRLAPQQHEFVDVFTLSPEGMLRDCRRYYPAPPTA
ncbi:nuclear transport factor 2 family protein [Streptomyces sp. NPDC029003]|uniref:nuclear transport factor 2 family protein n=1 Tax=Streptomyces sp. NPDC029003 TaxID=3155125 RepID=UPI003403B0E6